MASLADLNVAPTSDRSHGPAATMIGGVPWPRHKLLAVTLGALSALLVLLVTNSFELTAWALAITATTVWISGAARARYAPSSRQHHQLLSLR